MSSVHCNDRPTETRPSLAGPSRSSTPRIGSDPRKQSLTDNTHRLDTEDHFATDARHLGELRARLAATGELIRARQAQHRQRTGAEMGPGHVWLTERNAELASLRTIITALETSPCGAVRGAGVPARPGQPVPVTISQKPGGHGNARG